MLIAVCDDDELFLRDLEIKLRSLSMADSVSVFSSLDAFLLSVEDGNRYDAVLMDIEWGASASGVESCGVAGNGAESGNRRPSHATGMDAATELLRICPDTKIIYVTGHVERFNQQVFLQRSNLSGFLIKPVDIGLLRANLKKVADDLPLQEQPTLIIHKQGVTVSVPFREIFFIECQRHIVHVHANSETISTYERLKSVMRALPTNFYQCHKSYIVNMNHISRIQSGDVFLKDGRRVPVSRARYNETKEAYHAYMGRKV